MALRSYAARPLLQPRCNNCGAKTAVWKHCSINSYKYRHGGPAIESENNPFHVWAPPHTAAGAGEGTDRSPRWRRHKVPYLPAGRDAEAPLQPALGPCCRVHRTRKVQHIAA